MDKDRLLDLMLGLKLGEQLIEIMNVPVAFHLRQHDHIDLVADFRDDLRHIVEHPRAVQRIDARPQARLAEIMRLGRLDEALARRFLGVSGNGVFQIAQQHVALGDHIADFRPDLLIVSRKEMDHPLQRHRQFAIRIRRADGERLVEICRQFHVRAIHQVRTGKGGRRAV